MNLKLIIQSCLKKLTLGLNSSRSKTGSFYLNRESSKQLIKTSNNNNNMTNEREQLKKEREELEKEIFSLVDKLESKKGPNEPRVQPSQVIKPIEEREALAKLAKLAISDQNKLATQAQQPAQPPQQQGGVGKKAAGNQSGRGKEALAPERAIDISRLDLRIGKIVEVAKHPDADALYVEKIDCGEPSGPRTVISGLVKHVPIEEMQDKLVLVLCNLKPVKMRGILSEAMVMCASSEEKVELLRPPADVKPGDRLSLDEYPGEPDTQLNPKKKVWEQVAPDIKTNDAGIAVYKGASLRVAGVNGDFSSNLKNVQIR